MTVGSSAVHPAGRFDSERGIAEPNEA